MHLVCHQNHIIEAIWKYARSVLIHKFVEYLDITSQVINILIGTHYQLEDRSVDDFIKIVWFLHYI